MPTVYATYDAEQITAQFEAESHPNDYGVKGSPVWWEIDLGTIDIISLEILGVEVDPNKLPEDLQSAIRELAGEVEFETGE